jgi:hypothetical protein
MQVQDPVGEEWGLEPGEGFSDGSVKWPRWFCLASGGMSLVQLGQDGNDVRWHAATLSKGCRHVAVNTEMYAMAAAAVYAPEQADFTLWADCQSVVSGFAQLERVADDHKNYYAGIWRIVRAALKDNGCRMSVKKVKAHRLVADVPEAEMFWWKGNEAADKWAKLGAEDRNEAWGDLVDKILTGNLRKARAVVSWLGEGEWPDGRALGKHKGCCARADFDLKPRPIAHEWTWYPKGWRCTKCGARKCKQGRGATACTERFDISGININHRHLRKAAGPDGIPIVYCAMCGGARTGKTGGLVKSCVLMSGGSAAKDRLKRLREGMHPYKTYKHPIQCLGPVGGDWASRERPPPAPSGGEGLGAAVGDVPDTGASLMVLGQELTARAQAELLALLRYEDELEAYCADDGVGFAGVFEDADVDDPFGFDGGDFDSP